MQHLGWKLQEEEALLQAVYTQAPKQGTDSEGLGKGVPNDLPFKDTRPTPNLTYPVPQPQTSFPGALASPVNAGFWLSLSLSGRSAGASMQRLVAWQRAGHSSLCSQPGDTSAPASLPWEPCPDFSPSIVVVRTKGYYRASVVTAPELQYTHGLCLEPKLLWIKMRSIPGRTRTPGQASHNANVLSQNPFLSAWFIRQLVAKLLASLLAGMRSFLWLMWAVLPRRRPSRSTQASNASLAQSSYLYPSLFPCPHASQVSKAVVAMELTED